MTTVTDTVHAPVQLDYVVKLEIDIDCEELLDAIGLPYERSEDDDTQNIITMRLTPEEYKEMLGDCMWEFKELNEVRWGCLLLNGELADYCTKVIIYKPNGDVISFS